MSDALINGLAGAGAGIFAQLLTYPLQTVNARQQTERDPSKPAFKDGAVRQLCLVVKNEGWERLYGGAVARRHRGLRAVAASLRRSIRGIGVGSVGMLQSLTVAALSGCVNVLLTNPIWVVVTRIQTHRKANKQQNPQDQGLTSGLDKALQTAPVENIPHKIINVATTSPFPMDSGAAPDPPRNPSQPRAQVQRASPYQPAPAAVKDLWQERSRSCSRSQEGGVQRQACIGGDGDGGGGRYGVNVQMISQGASKVNISLVVNDSEAKQCVQALHSAFFENGFL